MKFKVFTIYDDKAKAYLPPFFMPEVGQAVRAFADCVNDNTHQFGKHPSDYTLFGAGLFDDASGVFEPSSVLSVIARGLEVRIVKDVVPSVKPNGSSADVAVSLRDG